MMTVKDYRAELAAFDWTYQFTDDYEVFSRAEASLAVLREMQVELDTDGSVWLEYSKKHGDIGIPQPQILEVTA